MPSPSTVRYFVLSAFMDISNSIEMLLIFVHGVIAFSVAKVNHKIAWTMANGHFLSARSCLQLIRKTWTSWVRRCNTRKRWRCDGFLVDEMPEMDIAFGSSSQQIDSSLVLMANAKMLQYWAAALEFKYGDYQDALFCVSSPNFSLVWLFRLYRRLLRVFFFIFSAFFSGMER